MRVGVDRPADDRLFESGLAGVVAADAFACFALRNRGVGVEFQRFGLFFLSGSLQCRRQCAVALFETPFRDAARREQKGGRSGAYPDGQIVEQFHGFR